MEYCNNYELLWYWEKITTDYLILCDVRKIIIYKWIIYKAADINRLKMNSKNCFKDQSRMLCYLFNIACS